jgi:hypothetical protein
VADKTQDRANANAQAARSFVHTNRFGSRCGWIKRRDTQSLAQSADANRCPRQAIACFAAHPIHGYRKLSVGPLSAEFANHLDWAGMSILGITSAAGSSYTDFGMTATTPMNGNNSLMGSIVEVNHDLLDQDSCEPLPGTVVRTRRIPRGRQIVRQRQQAGTINLRARSSVSVQTVQALLKLRDSLQRHIPPCFQFAGN